MQYVQKHNGNLPVYLQVGSILETEISAIYKTGDVLPSETKLAQRFNINRHTLRRAVDGLVANGLVDRVRGKGTFVVGSMVDYAIKSSTRFTENLESQGRRTHSRVLRKIELPADAEVAQKLGLDEGSSVLLIETLREVDGIPFCAVSHFLPYDSFYKAVAAYEGGSLHGFLQQQCDIRLQRAASLITAVVPHPDDAELLKVSKNSPVLRVKSLNVNRATGKPVEYAVTRFRGDAAQLSVQL